MPSGRGVTGSGHGEPDRLGSVALREAVSGATDPSPPRLTGSGGARKGFSTAESDLVAVSTPGAPCALAGTPRLAS